MTKSKKAKKDNKLALYLLSIAYVACMATFVQLDKFHVLPDGYLLLFLPVFALIIAPALSLLELHKIYGGTKAAFLLGATALGVFISYVIFLGFAFSSF